MDKKGFYTFPPVDTPLKGAENYAAWVLSMQYNLKAFGVWGYVQGKIKCPSKSSASWASMVALLPPYLPVALLPLHPPVALPPQPLLIASLQKNGVAPTNKFRPAS